MRRRERDLVMRFVDACEDMGAWGGLVFIFGGTAMIMGVCMILVFGALAILGAIQ